MSPYEPYIKLLLKVSTYKLSKKLCSAFLSFYGYLRLFLLPEDFYYSAPLLAASVGLLQM